MENKIIENLLTQYPIFQFGFLKTSDIEFKKEVRQICQKECVRYGHSWSCPPAVGTVSECKNKCLNYKNVLLFNTITEFDDTTYHNHVIEFSKEHEIVVHKLRSDMNRLGFSTFALSSQSCQICGHCTWPEMPCFHSDKMIPCIESHGILVTSAAEKLSMDFFYNQHTIIWYGMIFYN